MINEMLSHNQHLKERYRAMSDLTRTSSAGRVLLKRITRSNKYLSHVQEAVAKVA